jgi:hypothetical protein
MIFHFKDSLYDTDTRYRKMLEWVNTTIGDETKSRTWAFLCVYTHTERMYDRIIFTNLEDAAMFKLKYGDIISMSEG